ncbi:MAG: hypothetical protein J2P22_11325 [Nocardioides sp.]|nr:hypothetical protein [Nocardioides sp.]
MEASTDNALAPLEIILRVSIGLLGLVPGMITVGRVMAQSVRMQREIDATV